MCRLVLFLLITALVTTACFKTNKAYLPSNDPLVLVRFERLLKSHGIGFNKDSEGMYAPTDPKTFERMISLGHEALDIESSRSGLVVKSGCALSKLKELLDDRDVVYVISQVDGEQNLTTTESDFNKFKVMESYAGFETECANKV